jgi:hypothetical protein
MQPFENLHMRRRLPLLVPRTKPSGGIGGQVRPPVTDCRYLEHTTSLKRSGSRPLRCLTHLEPIRCRGIDAGAQQQRAPPYILVLT